MFLLQTDEANERIYGYTLHTPSGERERFSTMQEVLARVSHIPVGECCWYSLVDALIDLSWRDDQWGQFTVSQRVHYWDHRVAKVRACTVSKPPRRFKRTEAEELCHA